MTDNFLDEFLAEDEMFPGYSDEEAEQRLGATVSREAVGGNCFNGLACIERFGVPNRNVNLSMLPLARFVIPFSGEMRMVA